MTVLGKRKKSSGTKEPTGEDAIQDIFRRHFEAQFKPLEAAPKKADKKGKKAKAAKAVVDEPVGKKAKKNATVIINENESDEEDEENEESGNDGSEEDSDSDDWSGLDDDDEDEDDIDTEDAAPAIEVVDYSTDPTKEPEVTMSKHERKLYLSKRPPTSFDEDAARAANSKKNKKKEEGDKQYKDAPDLLANDLELQRLISESHLLSGAFALPSSFSTSSGAASTFGAAGGAGTANLANHKSSQPFAAGRLRQKATDLRIQAVANKAKGDGGGSAGSVTVSQASDSIFTQAKMPMAMRKGIVAAAAARDKKRRQEAKESGIVLERPTLKPSKSAAKRMRAVDAPAVGRLRGSELKLRDRDVREIEGPRKTMGKKKKKRR